MLRPQPGGQPSGYVACRLTASSTLPLADGEFEDGCLGSDEAAYIFRFGGREVGVICNALVVVDCRDEEHAILLSRVSSFYSRRAEVLVSKFHLWHDGANAVSVAGGPLVVETVSESPGESPELADRHGHQDSPTMTLNANLVRAEDAGLVRGVCRFQCDRGALRRSFSVASYPSTSATTIFRYRRCRALDEHDIAVQDTCLDHRVSLDFQCIVIAAIEHSRRTSKSRPSRSASIGTSRDLPWGKADTFIAGFGFIPVLNGWPNVPSMTRGSNDPFVGDRRSCSAVS